MKMSLMPAGKTCMALPNYGRPEEEVEVWREQTCGTCHYQEKGECRAYPASLKRQMSPRHCYPLVCERATSIHKGLEPGSLIWNPACSHYKKRDNQCEKSD